MHTSASRGFALQPAHVEGVRGRKHRGGVQERGGNGKYCCLLMRGKSFQSNQNSSTDLLHRMPGDLLGAPRPNDSADDFIAALPS